MSRLLVWVVLLLAYIYSCDSRSYSSGSNAARSGTKNFGFFPTFAATRTQVPSNQRLGRSASSVPKPEAPESDALNVDDFIARNGLDFGKGDEDFQKDADVMTSKRRAKRQDEEPVSNDLSWLLDQDAWEKVDDAEMDWDNVGKEEFDVETALSREARDVDWEGQEGVEDDIDKKFQQITSYLKKIGKQIKGLRSPSRKFSFQDIVGSSSSEEYNNELEDNHLDPSTWRRKRSAKNKVVEIEGRIDMEFEAKPDNPIATVIIQKDEKSSEKPEVPTLIEIPPPIYFCGTKTDPNNPDLEISETVAAPPGAYKKIMSSLKGR